VEDLAHSFVQLLIALGHVAGDLLALAAGWLLLIVWLVWWLWAVNWRRIWPVLAQGAWMPVVLLLVVAAIVWSQISPSTITLFGAVPLGNFWWQLGAVALLAGLALFCGWLQGVFGGVPPDINLEPPPPVTPEHGHSHL
jgi:hypothetical protein